MFLIRVEKIVTATSVFSRFRTEDHYVNVVQILWDLGDRIILL